MRWCHLGVLQTSFVGIKYLEKADADSISKTVSSMLTDSGIDWQNKIVGIATDGAAVMMGVKNGVVARIKKRGETAFYTSNTLLSSPFGTCLQRCVQEDRII